MLGDDREALAARIAARIAAIWHAAVDALLAALADAVKAGIRLPPGAPAPPKFQRRAQATLDEAMARTRPELTDAIRRGLLSAGAEDTDLGPVIEGLIERFEPLKVQVFRTIGDAYRQAVQAALDPRTGITEAQRLENAQKILDDLATRGITGFTDKAGRAWDVVTYTEMATRTAVSRALVNVQLDGYRHSGVDTVLVVSRNLEAPCPKCRPFDGKVLSISGASVGQMVTVTPFGDAPRTELVITSLAAAILAGLLHPNCRHTLASYSDGSVMTPPDVPIPGAEVYRAEQRQRAHERGIRAARRREQVALTRPAQASARRHRVALQRASREHAAAHSVAHKPRRERLDVPR